VIEAYADAMFDLSRYVLARRVRMPTPRGIITSAGVLTDQMRTTIVEAFRAPVINRYGSREVGDVGCSCLSGTGIHISERSYLVEILDETGSPCAAGVEGNVVVTLFPNRTMPLIRYRIEDRAAWASEPCACGRNSRRLVTVLGRRNDFLVAADGTHINGTALTTLLYTVEGIHRFQYRQNPEGVVLSVVPRADCDSNVLEAQLKPLAERARQLLRGIPVTVKLVAQIPVSRSGKHRYVVNEVAMRD
jgi:phenylacetate-CoA ligase